MSVHNIVSLTSDFGAQDPFAGIMKGVILGINPSTKIVDITHSIEAHNLLQCYYILKSSYLYFPYGTVHCAVVDPGVGTERRPLAVSCDGHYFVGPDNGILSFAFHKKSIIIELTESRFFLPQKGYTFHGRDIFAPVSAELAKGTPIEKMGKPIHDPVRISTPEPILSAERIMGEVIYIDRFGNLTTNISLSMLEEFVGKDSFSKMIFEMEGNKGRFTENYESGEPDKPGALINSWENMEIFLNQGRAEKTLGVSVGDPVTVIRN